MSRRQPLFATDYYMVAVNLGVGTQAQHFIYKAEAGFKDILCNDRRSVRNGGDANGHRLQISREPRKWQGLIVHRLRAVIPAYAEGGLLGFPFGTG